MCICFWFGIWCCSRYRNVLADVIGQIFTHCIFFTLGLSIVLDPVSLRRMNLFFTPSSSYFFWWRSM
ncbi:hypothetical protein CGG79_05145 [Vibrio parahaemolyticus]|nr:hypothetical protein CGG95_01430 [Vibrio parahaemolyticus]TOR35076.1 hypothetical protein CGG79_05145 [Vibrio parahaemolyticus]